MVARSVVEACRDDEGVESLGRNCLTQWVVSLDGGLRYRGLQLLSYEPLVLED